MVRVTRGMRPTHFKVRKPARTIFIVAAALSLIACTDSKPRADLVVALSAPPSSLDPLYATDATGMRIAGLLYSSLVRLGPDLKPTLESASSFTQNGTSLTFEVRPHLTFNDGHELEARDLQYSFDQFKHSAFASTFNLVESVKIENLKITFHLKKPSATFLSDLQSFKLISKDHAGGTGPFRLELQTSSDILLNARETPYAKPKIKSVDFKIVRDDNTRVLKMLKGEIDVAQAEFPPLKIAQLETSAALKIYKFPGLALTYLLVNLEDPFLAKKQTRVAMASALHVADMIKYKMHALAEPATSLLTPINPYFDHALTPISPDATLAAQHEPSPELVLKTSSSPTAIDNGKVIANDLRAAGFKIKTQSYEWGTFYGDIQNGRFQLAIMRWVGTVDPDLYRKAFHSRERPPGGRNRGHYANPDVDRLTEEGAQTLDPQKRKQIYDEIQKQVFADLPMIPLWYDTEVAVVSTRVLNYEPATDGSFWFLTKVETK